MQQNRKTQLVCPNCHHEFAFDNGYYDRELARLQSEIRDIISQLAEHRLKPYHEQRANTDWWLRAKKALAEKEKDYADLKSLRKLANQQRQHQENQAFKNAVKDLCGEKVYRQCLEAALETTRAYNVSDLAKTPYSHKSGDSVTSINKL